MPLPAQDPYGHRCGRPSGGAPLLRLCGLKRKSQGGENLRQCLNLIRLDLTVFELSIASVQWKTSGVDSPESFPNKSPPRDSPTSPPPPPPSSSCALQVSDLAQILNVPIREVQAALAIASRLGFATPVTGMPLGVDPHQVSRCGCVRLLLQGCGLCATPPSILTHSCPMITLFLL